MQSVGARRLELRIAALVAPWNALFVFRAFLHTHSRLGHAPNPAPRCHHPSRCFTVDIVRCQFGRHRSTLSVMMLVYLTDEILNKISMFSNINNMRKKMLQLLMNNIFHSIKVNLHDSISTKNLNLLCAFTIHLHSKQHLGGLKNF